MKSTHRIYSFQFVANDDKTQDEISIL